LRQILKLPLPIVSGGNSASIGLLPDNIPAGITQLRLGESILFGQEACERQPVPGSRQDAFTVYTEVVELQHKPTMPSGKIGIDAFGNVPVHIDRGIRQRAIAAIGRQDTVPEDLLPLWPGVEILGASSDHMILDVEDASPPIKMGDVIPFRIRYYSAMLQGFTSPYLEKTFI
jgi:predicted amino acid racemase